MSSSELDIEDVFVDKKEQNLSSVDQLQCNLFSVVWFQCNHFWRARGGKLFGVLFWRTKTWKIFVFLKKILEGAKK